jgi:hypothetical protein
MLESLARTLLSQVVGAGLALGVTYAADQGIDLRIGPEQEAAVFGVLWIVLTGLYAAAQRKFWPIQTDAPGSARTDVTAGGKVV